MPRLRKKSAEGRVELAADQRKMQKTQPSVAIFRGKNYLGQTDKASFEHSGPDGKPIPISIVDFRNVPTNDDTK